MPRGPQKRIAWDHGSLLLLKENILELLHIFLNQFLSGGYNVLMQSIRDDIRKEQQDIQNADVIIFFKVAQFVIAFQRQKVLLTQNMQGSPSGSCLDGGFVDNLSFHGDFCGPIASTINEAMFYLVISKWRETFEGLKETKYHNYLSATGSLMKNMIQMLDLVLKLLPEDSKEPHTARILLYKLFYDQTDEGLTQFLLNLFRSFDTHKQPKSDLADLLEIVHIVIQLMEKLQAHGTLRVAKKSRNRRTKKSSGEVGSDRLKVEHPDQQNAVDQTNEAEKVTSELFPDPNKANGNSSKSSSVHHEGISTSNQDLDPDTLLKDTLIHEDNLFPIDGDKENKPNDVTYKTEDSSDEDQLPATNEVDFNVTRLVSTFANNTVIQNLCWLLKYYKSNSASTNHYIICMLKRFCDDLELSPMLYQLSLLTIFYGILSDQKASKSKDYTNIIHFITKFLRKMMKTLKNQPLLFVEMLFWKTRRECHYINADALICDLAHLKKDIRNLDNERADSSNSREGACYKSLADSLGDDEFDNVVPPILNSQGEEELSDTVHLENIQKMRQREHKRINILTDEMDGDKSEGISSELGIKQISRRRKGSIFDAVQEIAIRQLYEKYKDDRHCSRLIAEALDPEGKISPVQVYNKLKQLGLKFASRKRSMSAGMHISTEEDTAEGVQDASTTGATIYRSNEPNDSSYLKTSRRKRICSFSKEQELEMKVLFERFKNEKKCSQLIANALDADNTYTAAQVLRKLRQLGLLAPQGKGSSTAAKQSGDNETIELEDQSEEETLQAIKDRRKRKKNKTKTQEAMTTISQEDTDDETLDNLFKRKRKKSKSKTQEAMTMISQDDTDDGTLDNLLNDVLVRQHESEAAHTDGHEADASAALVDDIEQDDKTHDVLIDVEDSEDDMGTVVPKNVGSRRNLKMVIDAEDDE